MAVNGRLAIIYRILSLVVRVASPRHPSVKAVGDRWLTGAIFAFLTRSREIIYFRLDSVIGGASISGRDAGLPGPVRCARSAGRHPLRAGRAPPGPAPGRGGAGDH